MLISHEPLEQPSLSFACVQKEDKIIQKCASLKVTSEYCDKGEVNTFSFT